MTKTQPPASEAAAETLASKLQETLILLAPGTPLRDGLERIQRGRTGAIVVLGDGPEVAELCDGGIEFEFPFAATKLRELAKMDGAIVLSDDLSQIRRANVQLVPSPRFPTAESGTRHRNAERTALQSGRPVIAVSSSMGLISLYVDGQRHVLEEPAKILSRANHALSTMERYRSRLDAANQRLLSSEIHNYATVSSVVAVLRRELLLKRVGLSLDHDVLELGTDGRQLNLQLTELRGTNDRDLSMLLHDYLALPEEDRVPGTAEVTAALSELDSLNDEQLLNAGVIADTLGLPSSEESLSQWIVPRGYRALSRIPRVPTFLMDHVITEFKDLRTLLAATEAELAAVDAVGPTWAGYIYDGLARLRR